MFILIKEGLAITMKFKKILTALAVSIIAVSAMSFASVAEEHVLFEGEASSSDWGQACKIPTINNEDGTLDPDLLQSGCVIYVTYTGVTPEVILQSWSGGEGWAKVAPAEDDGSVAVFTYDDMVASYKTDDMSLLDQLNVGDTGGEITVTKVVLSSMLEEPAEVEEPIATHTEEPEKPSARTGAGSAAVVIGLAITGTGAVLVSRKMK